MKLTLQEVLQSVEEIKRIRDGTVRHAKVDCLARNVLETVAEDSMDADSRALAANSIRAYEV